MSLRSMGCGRIESSFSDMSISAGGGFGSSSGFGLSIDIESFSTKSKGHPSSPATAPPKGLGMQLGKSQKTNQFLESLKAEGKFILEDVQLMKAVNCWPYVSGNETYVSIGNEASSVFDLQNVVDIIFDSNHIKPYKRIAPILLGVINRSMWGSGKHGHSSWAAVPMSDTVRI
uniref:Coatomer subunit delta n=1 Tax=Quercus lobata TaxID=97700 RepID=A0A7N2LQE7_QUELO